MRLGIDASNIRAGGGVTHLVELLRASDPSGYGFEQVTVWGGATTLRQIEDRHWLRKVHEPMLDRGLPWRIYWQRVILDRVALKERCRLFFVPGGTYTGMFRPFVTMSQNMLPFEWTEARRYGLSWMVFRCVLLRKVQSRTFRRADGVIFLSNYARDLITKKLGHLSGEVVVTPHGVNKVFFLPPRVQGDISSYSSKNPFSILYVSTIDEYKHQWHVAEAVGKLRAEGLPVQLNLVGPAYPASLKRLRQALRRLDPREAFLFYRGQFPYSEVSNWYRSADLFVFASSCENMPNILLEAMASGLPIACSNRGAMPEVLEGNGLYFDPEKPQQIAVALQTLIENKCLRENYAWGAFTKAQTYSWQKCAQETFTFIAKVAKKHQV
jgi:glycosyltransferase involved in cell wall biosynthesis